MSGIWKYSIISVSIFLLLATSILFWWVGRDASDHGDESLPIPSSAAAIENTEVNLHQRAIEAGVAGDSPDGGNELPDFSPREHDLRLLALFQTHEQKLASAVIYEKKYGAYRYKVGDFLGHDFQLVTILPDRVILRYIDNTYALHLQPFGVDEVARLAPDLSASEVEVEEPYVSDEESKRKRFLARLDLYPVSEGIPDGYVVGDRVPDELSQNIDIQPGDIIVSLNGYPLGEHSNDYLAWGSYQSTQKASVVVRRGGREFVINHPPEPML